MRIEKRVRSILKAGRMAGGATEETNEKAERVYMELTQEEKARLKGLGPFDQPNELTQMFGDKSEKGLTAMGMFPLWVGIVLDMLKAE